MQLGVRGGVGCQDQGGLVSLQKGLAGPGSVGRIGGKAGGSVKGLVVHGVQVGELPGQGEGTG